jgi:uroporphyrinogen-III synthase
MAQTELPAARIKARSMTWIAFDFIFPISPHLRGTPPACAIMTAMPFDGLRVLSLESRRAAEMATLIHKQGGDPFVAPSMREMPLEANPEAFFFAERLFAGDFDMIILLTGVGTRYLDRVLSTRYPAGKFIEALRQITVVVRGPKPAAVMREWQVPFAVQAPEPNTWRELLAAIEGRPERRVAVQEYGKPNQDLLAGLRASGRDVTTVRVYEWGLPEDTAPLREAVHRLAEGKVDVALFTTSIQVAHLFRIAAEEHLEEPVRAALQKVVIASIGPTTSEELVEYGIKPHMEPTHPKMGLLVNEAAAFVRSHQ